MLFILISAKGVPTRVSVRRGLDPGLDKEAIRAVRSWRFEPGTVGGKAMAVTATVELNFALP